MLSFRQIFAALPAEQQVEAFEPQEIEHACEPTPVALELLASVSGGKSDIPGGGW